MSKNKSFSTGISQRYALALYELSKEGNQTEGFASSLSSFMKVYNSNEEINYEKKIDHSPLTIADKKSHETIVNHLQKTDIKIISEESKTISFDERRNWDIYWLVDPLDGTKEFIKKNGEFTTNIALIYENRPIFLSLIHI